MKIGEKLDTLLRSKDTMFSVEILPPLKGQNIQNIYDTINVLSPLKPCFIAVTYHRQEYDYRRDKNGIITKILKKKRPGTTGICAAIQNRYQIPTLAHLICAGYTAYELESILLELSYLQIENVLVLRGDNSSKEKEFTNVEGGYLYASDLLRQAKNMNEGIYMEEDLTFTEKLDFCLGVAGYPEKHMDATSFEEDLQYLKQKVEIGADFIITQMFFDNNKFFEFEQKCRDIGITVPIIPGLKPLQTKKHLKILPSIFRTEIPEALVEKIESCKDTAEVRQAGIDWCIQQSKELKEAGIPCLHYYSMGKPAPIKKIIESVF